AALARRRHRAGRAAGMNIRRRSAMPVEQALAIPYIPVLDFLLATIGSHGDVHPFVGLGAALKQRGHRVTLMLNEHFVPLAQKAELETIALGSDADFREGIKHPDLWRSHHAFKAVMGFIIPLLKKQY